MTERFSALVFWWLSCQNAGLNNPGIDWGYLCPGPRHLLRLFFTQEYVWVPVRAAVDVVFEKVSEVLLLLRAVDSPGRSETLQDWYWPSDQGQYVIVKCIGTLCEMHCIRIKYFKKYLSLLRKYRMDGGVFFPFPPDNSIVYKYWVKWKNYIMRLHLNWIIAWL